MSIYTIRQGIRQEIAAAVVRQSEPGYDTQYHGEYFAVDTDDDDEFDAVMYRGATLRGIPGMTPL